MVAILKFILWQREASATQTEPAWYDQSDIFEPQHLQGYSEQAGGGPGWKRMCQWEESYNSQAVIRL